MSQKQVISQCGDDQKVNEQQEIDNESQEIDNKENQIENIENKENEMLDPSTMAELGIMLDQISYHLTNEVDRFSSIYIDNDHKMDNEVCPDLYILYIAVFVQSGYMYNI